MVADEELETNLEKGQLAGIRRVVSNMKKFSHDVTVQEGGIEAMMALARHGLAPRQIVSAEGIESLTNAMNGYPKSHRIQWRGCAVVTDLCRASDAVCSELGKRGAVASVMNAYER